MSSWVGKKFIVFPIVPAGFGSFIHKTEDFRSCVCGAARAGKCIIIIIGRRQNWQPDIKEKKRLDRPKSEKLGC